MAKERSLAGAKKKEVKKETGLGLTHRKADNFGEWYSEVFHFEPFNGFCLSFYPDLCSVKAARSS